MYGVNNLELLGVVWIVKYVKYNLFGKCFTVLNDHRALLSLTKEHRSKNLITVACLSSWVDRFLTLDFNIKHVPVAKTGLVGYNSRQPNQKAKVTKKYEEFAVATITRIRDAIAAFSIKLAPLNCQSWLLNAVITTNSTRATNNSQTNHFNLLFALNSRTSQLLASHSANAALFHALIFDEMKFAIDSPQTPSGNTGRVNYQYTPNLEANTTRSFNEGTTTLSSELLKKEVFELLKKKEMQYWRRFEH